MKTRVQRKTSLDRLFEDMKKAEPLDTEEEQSLLVRAHAGDENARAKVIVANMRFAVDVAKKYQNNGVEFADLVGAAFVGLSYAADRYNLDSGLKFITYAVWWIRQNIWWTIEHGREVRIPANRTDDVLKVKNTVAAMRTGLNREPTDFEVADAMGLPLERVRTATGLTQAPVALDSNMEDYKESPKVRIPCTQPLPDADLEAAELHDLCMECMDRLPKRERQVIAWWAGFGCEPQTYQEIGKRLGLSRERVRQIRRDALDRLHLYARQNKLTAYA